MASALLLGASAAHAIVFTGSSGTLAASADFTQSGGNLIVTLTNTSAADVVDPAGVLTAVFFNYSGGALTPVSALLGAGSTVFFDAQGQPAGGNVGGEWAYSGTQSYFGSTRGISSSGFGTFGDSNFNGPDLDAPDALNGLNYGILSAGDNTASGNAAVTGGSPLIKNSVVFTLSGLSGSGPLPAGAISGVWFQYGTALNTGTSGEPGFPGQPGPGTGVADGGSTIILCGLAFSALALASRRFGRKAA